MEVVSSGEKNLATVFCQKTLQPEGAEFWKTSRNIIVHGLFYVGICCLITPIDLQNIFHKHVQLGHTFLFVLQHVSGSLKVPEFQLEFTRCVSSKSQHHCYWHHRFQKLQSATQYVQGKIWWHWIWQTFVRSSLTNRTTRVSLWALLLQVKMCMSVNSYWRKGPAFDFFSCSSINVF